MKKCILSMMTAVIAVSAFLFMTGCETSPAATLTLGDECIEGITVPSQGGRFSFTYVLKGAASMNVIGIPSEDWITDIDTDNPGVVYFYAEANYDEQGRQAVITMEYMEKSVEVLIVQDAAVYPEIVLETSSEIQVDAPGGWIEIRYSVENEDVRGSINPSSEEDWLGQFDCSVDGVVRFWADINDLDSERYGTVVLEYQWPDGSVSIDMTVNQGAKEYDREFAAVFIHGFYYGESETPGLYDYFFYFTDLGFDDAGYQNPYSTVYGIYIQSETEWTDMENIGIPEGTYAFADTYGAADTFTNHWMSYAYYNPEGDGFSNSEEASYTDGTLTVRKEGDNYVMTLIADLEDQVRYKPSVLPHTARVTYYGPVSLIAR